jgi:transposase InsO family protein
MSGKGNCWDNGCAESFFKTLKTELAILKKGGNVKEIRTAVFEYIEIYSQWGLIPRPSGRLIFCNT